MLSCKSFVILGYAVERPIEPSSSWSPPKYPSGYLELNSLFMYSDQRYRELLGGTFGQQFSPSGFRGGETISPKWSRKALGRNFWPPPAGTSYLGETSKKVSPKCGVGVLTWAKLLRPGLQSFAQVNTQTPHSGETLCKPSLGTLGRLFSLLFSSLLFSSLLFSSLLFSSRLVSSRLVSSHHVSSLLLV